MRLRLLIKLKPYAPPPALTGPPRANNRFHERLPVKCRFSIYADDQTGQRCIVCRGINMSTSGALVEAAEAIQPKTLVYVKASGLGLMGSATVRHCTASGSKFRIGLHFPNPLIRSL
ncbi:MAG TPA: PilZ domain-containing protein [Bryobacteraceae bacterium]|nr:PilZ domain-containing protein [Bryobacteraceae bacterium]